MDRETTVRLRKAALRLLARAQRERSSLTRIGLIPAATRAHMRAQELRRTVQALTGVLS